MNKTLLLITIFSTLCFLLHGEGKEELYFVLPEFTEAQALEVKATELNEEYKKLRKKLNHFRKEYSVLSNSESKEDNEKAKELEINFKSKQKRYSELKENTVYYNRYKEAIDSINEEIIREETFLRRRLCHLLKKNIPCGLYKKTSFYKRMRRSPSLLLNNYFHENKPKLKEYIAKLETNISNYRWEAFRDLEIKFPKIKSLDDEREKETLRAKGRLEFLSETVPEIKACRVRYNEIKQKMKDKSYTSEELDSNSLEELEKAYAKDAKEMLRQEATLAGKMDEEYRRIQVYAENIGRTKRRLLYEKWASDELESFEQYCEMIAFKLRVVAKLELIQLNERRSAMRCTPNKKTLYRRMPHTHDHGPDCKH